MLSRLAKVKRIRGFDELRTRSLQELGRIGDRLLSAPREMSDEALLREIAPAERDHTAVATAERIRNRVYQFVDGGGSPGTFLPSLCSWRRIVTEMWTRYPSEARSIIARAEEANAGRFVLLGESWRFSSDQIDWHLDPRSGRRAPFDHWSSFDPANPLPGGDPKMVWELNRHAHFVTFGQAYRLTGKERYAASFVAQANAWMDANPPGYGINWTSSLEIGLRSIAWLWAWHLCVASPHVDARFLARMLKYLIAHGRHIAFYLSSYHSPNTHLTGEALSLLYLGMAIPELRRARAWRELGERILVEQFHLQVRADGVYFEQSSYYHRYTTDFYIHYLLLSRAAGIEIQAKIAERLEMMLDHLMWIAMPDGAWPLFGDDDGGRLLSLGSREPDDFRDTLSIGAALYGRGDWKRVAGEAPAELLWLLGPEGLASYDEMTAHPARDLCRAFEESGYFVMRSGWKRSSAYLLADCGPHGARVGAGHAHSDALAFDLAFEGRTWLIDPGTCVYAAEIETRDAFRSTDAHNTATVDGEWQSIPSGPFAWKRAAECELRAFGPGPHCIYFEGSHNGYERLPDPVTHCRAIALVTSFAGYDLPAFVVISDSFKAVATHHYVLNFHFTSACTVEAAKDRVTARQGAELLTILVFGRDIRLLPRVRRGAVARGYGCRRGASVAIFEGTGRGAQEFLTLIYAGSPDVAEQIARKLEPEWREGGYSQWFRQMFGVPGPGARTEES